jgi:beta-lactamase regulating signal transducer with metallopeptidase domain
MNPFVDSLNSFSADWSAWLWRACWQGAIVIAIAWLLSLALQRSSPWLRSWVWRLAYVKLLLLLVWTSPINVPLLPAPHEPTLAAMATSPPAPTTPIVSNSDHDDASASRDLPNDAANPDDTNNEIAASPLPTEPDRSAEPTPPIADAKNPQTEDREQPITTATPSINQPPIENPTPVAAVTFTTATPSIYTWLFAAWSIGALLVVAWFAIETRRAFTLYRSARLVESAELAASVATVCRQLGLTRSVQLAESDLVGGPMLVKFFRPLIVFPSGMLANTSSLGATGSTAPNPISPSTGEGRGEGDAQPYGENRQGERIPPMLTPDEIRLVLAHELAHLKRHDLAWNALSALVHAALYFHPFVWFAHRCARQEQEMACDELVVTRLGVERHEYGQLLVKIVRQVGRQMNGAVATVGMSKSYQTLSRRIGAMGQFRKLTRAEMFAAASLLIIAATLTLAPWRLVAQEAKPAVETPATTTPTEDPVSIPGAPVGYPANLLVKPADSNLPGVEAAAPANGGASAAAFNPFDLQLADGPHDTSYRKLIVGTWRDQAGNRVIFFDDGTYDDLGVEIFVRQLQQRQGYPTRVERLRGQGDWSIREGYVHLTNDASQRYWDKDAKSIGQNDRPQECAFSIRRLDDNFLRLTFQSAATATYFLRRVDEKSTDEKFAAIPAELRAFFDVAQFTPEEATTLLQYFDRYKDDTAPLQVVARLQQAQRRKMTLRELFGMKTDEVTAFQELLDEHTGSKETLAELAKGGQLSDIEQSAFGKTEPITKAFEQLAETRPGVWGHGSPPSKATQFLRLFPVRQFPSSNRRVMGDEQASLDKLFVYLCDLEQWYRSVAFQNHR